MPRTTVVAAHLVLAALAAAAAGCGAREEAPDADSHAAASADRPPTVTALSSPAAPMSGEPFLAEGPGGSLHLSWIERSGETAFLRYARFTGSGWDTARTIASGDDWFVNWADVPSLAVGENGVMAAHWLQKEGEGTYAYGVRVALSRDGGVTWSDPVTPHTDGTESEHGFASIVPHASGAFDLVWLDGRATGGGHDEPAPGDDGHGGAGSMTLRTARIAPDGALSLERAVDERVCDCCPTDAARLADGTLLVVYRDRSPEEVRDIGVLRGADDMWTAPAPVHDDGWNIPGCPVNGPALAVAGDRAVCAWFTMGRAQESEVRAAFSGDGGRTFGAPVRVDDGSPLGRVDVAMLDDGAALVTWIEASGGEATVRARRVDASGAGPSHALTPIDPSRASGFPKLARAGDAFVLAWTEASGDSTRVRTARVTL